MSTLQALGNLGEFVGAVGVVISLVYLAQQMSQNTTSVRAASFNSMVQNSIRLLEHAFVDSEFAAFLARAGRNPDQLTPAERVRWDSYMTAVYRHFGNLVYQFRVGALDQQMWSSYRSTLKDHLRDPAWSNWFKAHQYLFSSALIEQVDVLLEELASEPGLDGAPGAAPLPSGDGDSGSGRSAPTDAGPAHRLAGGTPASPAAEQVSGAAEQESAAADRVSGAAEQESGAAERAAASRGE